MSQIPRIFSIYKIVDLFEEAEKLKSTIETLESKLTFITDRLKEAEKGRMTLQSRVSSSQEASTVAMIELKKHKVFSILCIRQMFLLRPMV